MRRRDCVLCFIAAALAAFAATAEPPDDEVKINAFADAWNEYVGKLQRWIRDRKVWQTVVKRWERL